MPTPQPVIPLLVYEDIEAAHEFLVGAFGLGAGRLDRDQDGRVVHGEVDADGQVIWLHRATREHELASASSQSAASGGLVVNVEDVDAHFDHARASGARVDHPPPLRRPR